MIFLTLSEIEEIINTSVDETMDLANLYVVEWFDSSQSEMAQDILKQKQELIEQFTKDKRVIEHFAKEKKEGNIKIKRNKLGELANCFHSACWRSAIYEIATNDPFTDEIVINQKWISRLINEGDEKMFQKVGEYVDLSNYKIEK